MQHDTRSTIGILYQGRRKSGAPLLFIIKLVHIVHILSCKQNNRFKKHPFIESIYIFVPGDLHRWS